MYGLFLLGREAMYELAALRDPPMDGSAVVLLGVELEGPLFRMFYYWFPRPFVFQRWWYRDHAEEFLEYALFL